MQFTLVEISTFSILVPLVVACIKFPKLLATYFPFVLFIWVGFLTELASRIVIGLGYSNNLVLNIYTLVQALLLLWQFRKWELFNKNKNVYYALLVFFTVFWLTENVIIKFYAGIDSYFIITSSYIIAIMCVTIINRLVVKEHGSLLKNARFLICVGWLVYFTYSVMAESFYLNGLAQVKPLFAARVYSILLYINIFSNFVFAIATLWIPTKPRFILPS